MRRTTAIKINHRLLTIPAYKSARRDETTKRLRVRIGSVTFETFQEDRKDRTVAPVYRWHASARNGRLVATSGESFDKMSNAERAMTKFILTFAE